MAKTKTVAAPTLTQDELGGVARLVETSNMIEMTVRASRAELGQAQQALFVSVCRRLSLNPLEWGLDLATGRLNRVGG